MGSITKPSWEEVVAAKRAIREAAIQKHLPKTSLDNIISPGEAILPFSSAKVKNITDIKELKELQEKLATGELTAVEVISAYIER